MNDWSEPGTGGEDQVMEKVSDDPLVYAITFTLLEGTYTYKYFSDLLGEGWDGAEWDDMPDREIYVEDDMEVNDMFGPDDLSSAFYGEPVARVFPNPAKRWLHIEASELIRRLQLLTVSGQHIYDERPGSPAHSLQVRNIQPGLYLLRIHTSAGIETHKIQITP